MRIEDLRTENLESRIRVAARVTWEDCDRPAQDIYFETDAEYSHSLSCNPHAFLLACLLPAMRHGEERIAINEAICPELENGLLTAMGWINKWYPHRRPARLEPCRNAPLPVSIRTERSGSFLSGGIDSLATLRANHLDFPTDHPRSIKDCLLVCGFDVGGFMGNAKTFQRNLASLSVVAEDAGVSLMPASTNLLQLENDMDFWMFEFHGAALAAVAHAFSGQLTCVSIASTYDISRLKPWGSHPLLDPNYGSTSLRIHHDGVRFSRLEKVRLVASWDVALQQMRVCTTEPGVENCGTCEKCIRTMSELLAIGKLNETMAFPVNDVSEELLSQVRITNDYQDSCYRELINLFREMGRHDLADVIAHESDRFHKHLIWEEERDWKGAVKRFDRQHLRGGIFRTYKAIRDISRKGV